MIHCKNHRVSSSAGWTLAAAIDITGSIETQIEKKAMFSGGGRIWPEVCFPLAGIGQSAGS